MPTILHIIPNLRIGGAERLVVDIVREFVQRKDLTVKLVLFENTIDYSIEDIRHCIQVIPSHIKLSIHKQNEYQITQLQNFIDDFNPDIIHSHLFEAEIVSRTSTFPNAKWFSHCHDNMVQFKNFSLYTLFDKKQFTNFYEKFYLLRNYRKNGGTLFIAISKDVQRYFLKNNRTYPVSLLKNAINYNRFKNPKKRESESKILRLINVGSFVDKKNQLFLIDIALELKKMSIPFEVHLLGDGINKLQIQAKINKYQLQNYIHLYGNVGNVEEYLWKSDIYVHTATYEPLGLVLIEAMAAGLPVITLDGKGNRDLIEKGENGFILFEENAKKFADTITQLWEKKEELANMSKYAQEYAKQYDIKEYCDKLLAIYDKE